MGLAGGLPADSSLWRSRDFREFLSRFASPAGAGARTVTGIEIGPRGAAVGPIAARSRRLDHLYAGGSGVQSFRTRLERKTNKNRVLCTEDGEGGSGVTLSCGPSVKLAIYAGTLVGFGGNHVEASENIDTWIEADVGATSGHVGGDGNA